MIFKEEGYISEEGCKKMEPVPELKRADHKINSLSSKNYCLEETNVVGEKCYAFQTSWFDNGVLLLKTDNLSLFDSQSSSSSSDQTEDEEMVLEIQTPTKSIFNPFAPGADDLMLAPKRKKLKNSHVYLQRRLDFGIDYEADAVKDSYEENQFFSSVFNSMLKMIVSIQLEEISAEAIAADSDIYEDLILLPRNAETCPPAPMRLRTTFKRHRHPGICRKLDFEVA